MFFVKKIIAIAAIWFNYLLVCPNQTEYYDFLIMCDFTFCECLLPVYIGPIDNMTPWAYRSKYCKYLNKFGLETQIAFDLLGDKTPKIYKLKM